MEIKGINGAYSAYRTQKNNAPKKTSASVSSKSNGNTDRVEFGFDAAIAAARAGIAQEVNASASPQELVEAQKTADEGVPSEELAAYILMG